MRLTVCILGLWLSLGLANAQMVRNNSLGQNPTLERLCAERARNGAYWIEFNGRLASEGWTPEKITAAWKDTNLKAKIISQDKFLAPINGNLVPFKISAALAESAHWNGFHTLIALDNGVAATLVECYSGMRGDQPSTIELLLSSSDRRWSVLTKEDLTPPPAIPKAAPSPPTPVTSESQIQKLTAELDFNTQQLKFHEDMLAASSFADRTDLFCTDAAEAALANQRPGFATQSYNPSPPIDIGAELQRSMIESQQAQNSRDLLNTIPHGPYGLTLNDLKAAYAQLSKNKPPTREAEMLRQQKLAAISKAVANYTAEFNACRTAVIYGKRDSFGVSPPFPLPTEDALRVDAKQERERIAQIEMELRKLKK